jgi:hypothetical protein
MIPNHYIAVIGDHPATTNVKITIIHVRHKIRPFQYLSKYFYIFSIVSIPNPYVYILRYTRFVVVDNKFTLSVNYQLPVLKVSYTIQFLKS